MRWVILAVVLIGVLLVIATGERTPPSPEFKARADARSSIEACWQGYERKSLDPDQKRAIAAACELMEQKYRARYGSAP